jgi:hypothetical protein
VVVERKSGARESFKVTSVGKTAIIIYATRDEE